MLIADVAFSMCSGLAVLSLTPWGKARALFYKVKKVSACLTVVSLCGISRIVRTLLKGEEDVMWRYGIFYNLCQQIANMISENKLSGTIPFLVSWINLLSRWIIFWSALDGMSVSLRTILQREKKSDPGRECWIVFDEQLDSHVTF